MNDNWFLAGISLWLLFFGLGLFSIGKMLPKNYTFEIAYCSAASATYVSIAIGLGLYLWIAV